MNDLFKKVYKEHGVFCAIIPAHFGRVDSFIGWIYFSWEKGLTDIAVGDYSKGFSNPEEAETKLIEKLRELKYLN